MFKLNQTLDLFYFPTEDLLSGPAKTTVTVVSMTDKLVKVTDNPSGEKFFTNETGKARQTDSRSYIRPLGQMTDDEKRGLEMRTFYREREAAQAQALKWWNSLTVEQQGFARLISCPSAS